MTLLLRVRGNSPTERDGLRRAPGRSTRSSPGWWRERRRGGCAARSDLDPELVSRLLLGTVNSLVEWYQPRRAVGVDDLAPR